MTTRNMAEAANKAEQAGVSERFIRVMKAVQPGGTTSGSGLSGLFTAFMDSMKNIGAFESIAAGAMRVPLGMGRVQVFASVTAGTVNEAVGKPVRALTIGASDFTPAKVVAQVVMSRELIDASRRGLAGTRP